MTETARLVLAVDSRPVDAANRSLRGLEQQGRRTERATDQLVAAFRRVAGPIAAFLSTRQIMQASESWTTLNNRLRLVTDSTAELLAAQRDVFDIAQNARQPLEATAELYQRIAQNADELGLSGAGVAAIVDTINKSLAVSGTSGAAANAALIQLGQAFASGTLRGEELNSVLEQAPALAQALARGMGVSVGQLRALGQEGVLTAQNVVDALLAQGDEMEALFSRIEPTIAQAFTTLGNSLTRAVGEIDTATGASGALAGQLVELSEWIDAGSLASGILETVAIWQGAFSTAANDLGGLGDEFELFGEIGVESVGFVGTALQQLPANVKAMTQALTVEVASMFDRAVILADGFKRSLLALGGFGGESMGAIAEDVRARINGINQARADSLQSIFDEREAILATAEAENQRRDAERAALDEARRRREEEIAAMRASAANLSLGGAGGAGGSGKNGDSDKGPQKLSTEYADALMREADRMLDEVDARMQEHAEAYRQVQELKLAAMSDEERAVAELQEQYKELGALVMQGAVSQAEAAQIAAGLATRWAEEAEGAKAKTSDMSEFAKAAAQNMQSAFADFLFDPFKDGVDGMLLDFVNVLRRMAAEAVAAAIFDKIMGAGAGGGDGWLSKAIGWIGGAAAGSVGGGGAAAAGGNIGGIDGLSVAKYGGLFDSGGPIPAGQWGIAGEKGPEIITGPANVVSRKDTAAMMSQQPANVRVVPVFSEEAVADMLASSPAMEQVVIHHVTRNSRRLGL